jgi:hypothetical protein
MRRLLIFVVLCFALSLAIAAAAEAATGTIDPRATLSADRTMATVTGTVSCNPLVSGGFSVLSVAIQEVVGRLPVQGFGSTSIPTCTGASMPWSVTTQTSTAYVPGPASVSASFMGICFVCFPPVIDSWSSPPSRVLLLP